MNDYIVKHKISLQRSYNKYCILKFDICTLYVYILCINDKLGNLKSSVGHCIERVSL